MIDILSKVSPDMMRQAQEEDLKISVVSLNMSMLQKF